MLCVPWRGTTRRVAHRREILKCMAQPEVAAGNISMSRIDIYACRCCIFISSRKMKHDAPRMVAGEAENTR